MLIVVIIISTYEDPSLQIESLAMINYVMFLHNYTLNLKDANSSATMEVTMDTKHTLDIDDRTQITYSSWVNSPDGSHTLDIDDGTQITYSSWVNSPDGSYTLDIDDGTQITYGSWVN